MNIEFRKQKRKSLAFKLIPSGAIVLVPEHISPQSAQVQNFVAQALAHLPPCCEAPQRLEDEEIRQLVAVWQQRLKVKIARLQIRTMRNKWGSLSTAGILTLAEELLDLPRELVEYVVVHELLHLKFPDHDKGWQVSMSMYLPTWRALENKLAAYVITTQKSVEAIPTRV